MKGTIVGINNRNGLHAVRTDATEITIFQMVGAHEAKMRDIVSGNLETPGSETLFNETQNVEFTALIQEVRCSALKASELLNR